MDSRAKAKFLEFIISNELFATGVVFETTTLTASGNMKEITKGEK